MHSALFQNSLHTVRVDSDSEGNLFHGFQCAFLELRYVGIFAELHRIAV